MGLYERCKLIWKTMESRPTSLPTAVNIPASNVEAPESLGASLEPDSQYFVVRVNEMFLANSGRWFSEFDPMVYACAEFTYDKKEIAVPVVVGPSKLESSGQKLPKGMLFSNTRVAGTHPYRGDRLALTVILYRIERENWARRMLRVVESTAGALDFSTGVSAYVKVADAVLDGVEALLGLAKCTPVVGHRRELDPDAGDKLVPGYFALIDAPKIDPRTLWVRDNHLLVGESLDRAIEFRDADFVLMSLASTPERSGETTLPFYPLWEQVQKEAMNGSPDSFRLAKVSMATLNQMLMLSPDLTEGHAAKISEKYTATMKARHDRAVDIGNMGASDDDRAADRRRKSLSILDLK